MKTIKERYGIHLDQVIHSEDRDLNINDVNELLDMLIDFVESKGWSTGGGANIIDVNSSEEDELSLSPKDIGDRKVIQMSESS